MLQTSYEKVYKFTAWLSLFVLAAVVVASYSFLTDHRYIFIRQAKIDTLSQEGRGIVECHQNLVKLLLCDYGQFVISVLCFVVLCSFYLLFISLENWVKKESLAEKALQKSVSFGVSEDDDVQESEQQNDAGVEDRVHPRIRKTRKVISDFHECLTLLMDKYRIVRSVNFNNSLYTVFERQGKGSHWIMLSEFIHGQTSIVYWY